MEKTTTQELLAQAEKICAQRNVRLTPQRLEVLRLMPTSCRLILALLTAMFLVIAGLPIRWCLRLLSRCYVC